MKGASKFDKKIMKIHHKTSETVHLIEKKSSLFP